MLADALSAVASIVSAHARPGDFIYAGPDAPEVSFLTGMRNPTPTLFDFFDDPATRDARVLRAIDARGVRVAVVDTRPGFSAPPSAALVAGLRVRFAQGAAVGRFAIGWR